MLLVDHQILFLIKDRNLTILKSMSSLGDIFTDEELLENLVRSLLVLQSDPEIDSNPKAAPVSPKRQLGSSTTCLLQRSAQLFDAAGVEQ